MPRLTAVALALVMLPACVGDNADRYLHDAAFRRSKLVASLVNPANRYSELRLAHYAVGGDDNWDHLPEFNPPTRGPGGDFAALDLSAPNLGEQAFFRYPAQPAPNDISDGVVNVRYADGSTGRALTCASCHASAGQPGVANPTIDFGWGPQLVDVSAAGDEPAVAIPDLRPVRWQTHLQRAGAVRQPLDENQPITLAIRIETLLITAQSQLVRPPRAVTLALARYLHELAPPVDTTLSSAVFDATCAGCHAAPGRSGPPVPVAVVGTDAAVAESADRGTGGYRAPSLFALLSRGRLLHDGSIADLAQLLDPARRQSGPIGHLFGLELSPTDRAAIIDFLQR